MRERLRPSRIQLTTGQTLRKSGVDASSWGRATGAAMNKIFHGPVAGELHGFLQFKRSLGYGYARAEFALREFDRFLTDYAAKNRRWQLDRAARSEEHTSELQS